MTGRRALRWMQFLSGKYLSANRFGTKNQGAQMYPSAICSSKVNPNLSDEHHEGSRDEAHEISVWRGAVVPRLCSHREGTPRPC